MIVGEPTFWLKPNPDPKKDRLIIMQLSLGRGDRLVMSTAEKISPDSWDAKKQLPKGKASQVQVHLLNRYKEAVGRIVQELKLNNIEITSHEIKWRLEREFKTNAKSKPKTFVNLFETWRDGVKSKKILTTAGKKYSDNSYKPITSTLNHLIDYEKEKGVLSFSNIDLTFYSEFTAWLYAKKLSVNYVGITFKHIKSFIKWSWENGHTKSEIWRDTRFRRVEEDTTTTYLTPDEIVKMYTVELDAPLSNHRYNFVLNCCLGLRFGDLQTFARNASNHILTTDKGKLVKIINEKTDTEVVIPLHWMAQEILNRFGGDLPPVPSNQKFNEYIKTIAEKAKINKAVVVTTNKGGVRQNKTYPKYELITTHTARRSFATNLFLAKFPVHDIMRLTGHKTEKSFLRYIRADALEVAYSMLDNDYWKK